MPHQRAMKLFAVALLAGAAPAYADTATQVTRGTRVASAADVDWRGPIDIREIKPRELANGGAAPGRTAEPTAEQQALFVASLEYRAANTLPPIKPRIYANFRPACGNTGGKVERPTDCTRRETRAAHAYDKEYDRLSRIQEAEAAPRRAAAYQKLMAATEAAMRADPTLKVRLVESGRPACGNTMSKSGPPAYCRFGESEPQ